jgi:endonuclease-8
MPEGDTVWNTARTLDRALAGATVERVDLRVPSLSTVDLCGWRVRGCASRGKHLLLRFESGAALTLHSHLRMDGSWRVYGPGAPWRARPAHLIRAVVRTPTAIAVGYHLHDLALVATDAEDQLVGHLGPDLLGRPGDPGGWDPAEAVRRLRAHPDATLGEALLDQRNLAGVGNVYRCELLFLRGLHPRTRVSAVDDLDAVVALARRLLMANRGRAGHVTTGSLRRGEELWVYGRGGAPCRRCRTPVSRLAAGAGPASESDERVVYWCPTCQPLTEG